MVVHADASERWVGEHRVRRDATVSRAVPAAEVVGEDLVVLVRRVGERATAVDVAERPDAVDRGAEHAIGVDVAAVVGRQPDAIEVEAIGVRCPSDRRPVGANRRSCRRRRGGGAPRHSVASTRSTAVDVRISMPSARQEPGDLGGDLGILTSGDRRPVFDHRDRAPETAEELPELEADVAATEDDQVRRELLQVQDAVVVEPGDVVETGDRRLRGAGADVEEHLRRAQ